MDLLDLPFPARATAVALASLACLGIAGCGGGGSGDATQAVTVASAASTPPPASSAPASGPAVPAGPTTAASTCGVPDFVAAAIAQINARRAAGATCGSSGAFPPAGLVGWNEQLALAADAHSRDMVSANFFSHTGSLGSTLTSRVNATSYLWAGLAENLAAGTLGIQATLDGWMASPGHCANLMGASYGDVGLACVPGNANTAYRTYWTLVLGRPR